MENAMIGITPINEYDMIRQYREAMQIYEAAIETIRSKLEVLDRDFKTRYAYNPIHHIDSRLKSPESISGKLKRKGLPQTLEAAEANFHDIAGVRVVCNYVDDIYRIANVLLRQKDIEEVNRKDYIRSPKESGYRSLHLVVRVPVFLASHTEEVAVEIQIRTIAMDFWASLEHELRYKSDMETAEQLKDRLKRCAEISAALDMEMQSIYQEISQK